MENPNRNSDQNVTESRDSSAQAAEFGMNLIDSPLMEELMHLCELEIDAVTAYSLAIERLEDREFKAAMSKFCADHERHLDDFMFVILGFGGQPPMLEEEATGFKTPGVATLAGLDTDHAILKAMMANEVLTNELYDGILSSDLLGQADEGLRQMIEEHRDDERRHLEYIQDVVLSLDRGGKVSIPEQEREDIDSLEQDESQEFTTEEEPEDSSSDESHHKH